MYKQYFEVIVDLKRSAPQTDVGRIKQVAGHVGVKVISAKNVCLNPSA